MSRTDIRAAGLAPRHSTRWPSDDQPPGAEHSGRRWCPPLARDTSSRTESFLSTTRYASRPPSRENTDAKADHGGVETTVSLPDSRSLTQMSRVPERLEL